MKTEVKRRYLTYPSACCSTSWLLQPLTSFVEPRLTPMVLDSWVPCARGQEGSISSLWCPANTALSVTGRYRARVWRAAQTGAEPWGALDWRAGSSIQHGEGVKRAEPGPPSSYWPTQSWLRDTTGKSLRETESQGCLLPQSL